MAKKVKRLVNFIVIASLTKFVSEFDRIFVVVSEFVIVDYFDYFTRFAAYSNFGFITKS
jgi:voltage-gated potassium channel Kch